MNVRMQVRVHCIQRAFIVVNTLFEYDFFFTLVGWILVAVAVAVAFLSFGFGIEDARVRLDKLF